VVSVEAELVSARVVRVRFLKKKHDLPCDVGDPGVD